MADLLEYLKKAMEIGASDVFVVAGAPISVKVDGQVRHLDDQKIFPPANDDMIRDMYERAGRSIDRFLQTGDDDFSLSIAGLARFRVSAFRQRGTMGAVIRIVAFSIPDWKQIGILPQVMELADLSHGLVLFTGTAGSGKSTTQACIVDQINRTRCCHVITLEDPIEYLHRNNMSIVNQREIAIDTADCVSALRACLRQAPDVIQLGELRDSETIRAAMTAAETGHLIFATLHTHGAVNSIDRIIDSFSADQQAQIRLQLSTVLDSVVSQQLIPGASGGLVPAFEIMHMTPAIRSLIRDSKTHQIDNAISTGAEEGMMSADQHLFKLYTAKKISKETALRFADNPTQLRRRLD